jgi:alcohol dehydrogenase (cytochrome c)
MVRGTGTGAALYTNSTLALDPDTGKIAWYFQHHPRDNWNLDHAFERVLVDAKIGDQTRQILLTVGKPGIIWALDRKTGEFLWAKETVEQNVVSHIDPRTGRVTLNEAVISKEMDKEYFICPSFYGGKVWQATAYNPATNALYVPLGNLCMDYKVVEQEPTPGEDYGRGRLQMRHGPHNNGKVGRVEAVDGATGKTLWTHERRAYWSSALLTTASGLVFGGDANRRVVAFDAHTGRVLWELPLSGPISGFLMTYMVDGQQYLAIPTGPNLMADLAAKLTPEFRVPGRAVTLWVFALPHDER